MPTTTTLRVAKRTLIFEVEPLIQPRSYACLAAFLVIGSKGAQRETEVGDSTFKTEVRDGIGGESGHARARSTEMGFSPLYARTSGVMPLHPVPHQHRAPSDS